MSKGIFVATLDSNSGKSIVSLGMMRALLGRTPRVAFFRPIISDSLGKDNHLETVKSYFTLDVPYENSYAFTNTEVLSYLNKGLKVEIIDKIIEKYKALEDDYDFVLVEGTDFSGQSNIFEFDTNIDIAKNLGLPAILVSSGEDKTINEICGELQLAYKTYTQNDVNVLSVIANKVEKDSIYDLNLVLTDLIPNEVCVSCIPKIDILSKLTVREINENLGGKVLFGEKYLDNLTDNFGVGAMQLPNYLTHLKTDSLVITPGDRADILLGALQANVSTNYPRISGVFLTGGILPQPSILDLIEGLSPTVPIISVSKGTFGVANKIGRILPKITKTSIQKIEASIANFDKYTKNELIDKLIDYKPSKVITPRMFQYKLLKTAKKETKHIVLPEGHDVRVLKATAKLIQYNVVKITILGEPEKIHKIISKERIPLNLSKVTIINPADNVYSEDYINTFYELRKHKGVNLDMAKDFMKDVSYFGTMMVYKGHADGMVSGAVNTTQHTIRPALQFIKTKPGVSAVSSVFFMCLEDRVSVFGDCAINPNPTDEQLAEIAISSAESAKAFGISPKVAMLSYSSGNSGKGEQVDKVRKATTIVTEKHPELLIEGPIQYDAAVDMNVAKTKLPNSKVAGKASVLIFPDLNTGNNTYKAVQRETGAMAIGPMLQGLNKPVNDLSRGCTVNDIFNTVIITAIQSQEK